MSGLNALLIAANGFGFPLSAISIAVNGFILEIQQGKHLHQDTDQGRAGKNPPGKDYAAENLRRMYEQRKALAEIKPEPYNLTRLQQDDALATDLIVALVTKGFFDGRI